MGEMLAILEAYDVQIHCCNPEIPDWYIYFFFTYLSDVGFANGLLSRTRLQCCHGGRRREKLFEYTKGESQGLRGLQR